MPGRNYIGKICPYCQTALDRNDEVTICSKCDMPHHTECWHENGGCTVYGCKGSPVRDYDRSTPARDVNDRINVDIWGEEWHDQRRRSADSWGQRYHYREESPGCFSSIGALLSCIWEVGWLLFWVYIIFSCLFPTFCGS